MTTAPTRFASLLAELPGLCARDGLARARREGEIDEVLRTACDDAEKLVIVDLPCALAMLRALVLVADESGGLPARARTRRGLSQALAYQNDFQGALHMLSEAIDLAESSGDALEAARARMTTLHALARLGRLPEAVEAGEQALASFVAAGEGLLEARAHINLGVVWRMRDEPRRALAHFDSALPALDAEPVLRAQLESNRAEALLDLNDFQSAETAFTSALASFDSAGLVRAAAIVDGNIADLQSRQGRVRDALHHFERARRKLGELGAPGDAARLDIERAEALLTIGLAVDAAAGLETALPVLRERNMRAETARALNALARARMGVGRSAEALPLLREARELSEELGNTTGVARVTILESRARSLLGDRELARAGVDLAIAALVDRPAEQAAAEMLRAELALADGHFKEAQVAIEAALGIIDRLDLAMLRSPALHLRALCHKSRGDASAAALDFDSAVEELERVRGTLPSERARASFLGDRLSLFDDAIAAALDAADEDSVRRAFSLAERSKARSLLDQMHSAFSTLGRPTDTPITSQSPGATGEAELELVRSATRLRHELHALYAQVDGLLGSAARPADDAWRRAVAHREQALRGLELRLAATSRYGLAFSAPVTLDEAERSVPPNGAIVEYFEEGGCLSAFVITRESTRVARRIVPMREVDLLVESVRFQMNRAIVRGMPAGTLGARLTEDANRALAQLGRAVLGPFWNELRNLERVVFVPHAALHRVPFAALINDGEVVIDRVQSGVAPSVSVLAAMKSRAEVHARKEGAHATVVGVSDERIPQAEPEARAIAAIVPDADCILGSCARLERVRAAAQSSRVIHFAAHARFVGSDPRGSGVRLADGWLTAEEISSLPLDGATVVLSGCDTGRAALRPGDEILGLVRAFLLAGSSALVVSLWTLHDAAALEIMVDLYRRWYTANRGLVGLASALRAAQRDARVTRPHPAAWAPFIAVSAFEPESLEEQHSGSASNPPE